MIIRQRKIGAAPAMQLRSISNARSMQDRLDDPFYEPTILDAAEDLVRHVSAPARFVLEQAREFGFDIRLAIGRGALSADWIEYVMVFEKYDLAIGLEKAPYGDGEATAYIDALVCWLDHRNNAGRMRWILRLERAAAAKMGGTTQ